MQTDMHYYGTYAIARAAGFRDDIARTIATSAEYVDDSDRLDVVCKDGFEIHAEPTAHHPTDLKDNTDPQDQRRTWVPFHFIPGLHGDSVDEKLICVTDSVAARAVVTHTLQNLERPFAVPLLGILAHSYVDTFSHYGFSGISSKVNRVDTNSFKFDVSDPTKQALSQKLGEFFARYAIGPLANYLAQLGHGSVATYPDQPFLTWEFLYDSPAHSSGSRENPITFLAGCRRLHEVFVEARSKFNGVHDDMRAYREFDDIESAIKDVLAVERDDKARAESWQQVMKAGRISRVAEAIPVYDSSMFTNDLRALDTYEKDFATRTLVYAFLEAADFHRDFILNDLLAKNGIHIESAPIEWHTKET